MFARLANALIDKKEIVKAVEVLDRCLHLMPVEYIPLNYYGLPIIEAYYRAGNIEKALMLSQNLSAQVIDELRYILTTLNVGQRAGLANDSHMNMAIAQNLWQMANAYGQTEHEQELRQAIERYYPMLSK